MGAMYILGSTNHGGNMRRSKHAQFFCRQVGYSGNAAHRAGKHRSNRGGKRGVEYWQKREPSAGSTEDETMNDINARTPSGGGLPSGGRAAGGVSGD